MILGFNPPPNGNTTSTVSVEQDKNENASVKGFILVAGAAEDAQEYRTLEINEKFPFAYSISFVDVRGLSEEEIEKVAKQCSDDLDNIMESHLEDSNAEFSVGTVYSHENLIFTAWASNSIKLDLEDTDKIKAIKVKNSTEWGYVEYLCDNQRAKYDEVTGEVKLPIIPHGNDITIDVNDYITNNGRFQWRNSAEMELAINENPEIPLSTFGDTITFSVEYKDGSKAIGIIDVVFDDNGNATFTSRDYQYVE